MSLFYAATNINLRNGKQTSFWHVRWLDGKKVKILPHYYLSFARGRNGTRKPFMRRLGIES
jgi:hypothetical protein